MTTHPGENVGEGELFFFLLLVGGQTCTAILEICVVWFLRKLAINLPQDSAKFLLEKYLNDTQAHHKVTCSTLFIAALFMILGTEKQYRCPSIEEWMKKMWHTKNYILFFQSLIIFKRIQKVFQWNYLAHTKCEWKVSTKKKNQKNTTINKIVGYLEDEINWQVISYTKRQQDRERQWDRMIGKEKKII